MKIAVVIVNYNSGELLARCISHLLDQTRPADSIIVVDNASQDQSMDNLPAADNLQALSLQDNLGFAAANNLAFQHNPDADYFITLNPDAFPAKDFIQTLEKTAKQHPEYASYATRMMTNANTLDGAGDVYHISGLAWRHYHGRPYREHEHTRCEVFSPCAGAAMYQAADLEKAGGFDESFFCYMEDVDLGYRLQLRGRKCLYVPDAVVQHMGSAISNQFPGFAAYHGQRNLVWVIIKNTPALLLPLVLLANVLMSGVLGAMYILRGQFRIYLRAKIDALKGCNRMWRLRRETQKNRTLSSFALLRLYSYSFRRQ